MSTPYETSCFDEALGLVTNIARLSSLGRFIFRGEGKASHRYIASSLYRYMSNKYPLQPFLLMNLSLTQREMLDKAKQLTTETDEHEILATLRHNGGAVNLVDFTTDYNVALFFACDGSDADKNEDGRLIVMDRSRLETFVPRVPTNRVLAQKSIFVVPNDGRGVIARSDVEHVLTIPARLKPVILKHLRDSHDIRLETIYNDLLGFIGLQDRFGSPFAELNASSMAADMGDFKTALDGLDALADMPLYGVLARFERGKVYNQMRRHADAIDDLTVFIAVGDTLPPGRRAVAHMERGNGFLHMGEIEHATEDLKLARQLFSEESEDFANMADVSLATALLAQSKWDDARILLQNALDDGYLPGFGFHDDFGSVSDFNQKYNVKIPKELAEMLEPPEDETNVD